MTTAAVRLFDRANGTGADWPLMTRSLFKAAFVMLDGLPDDLRQAVARNIHESAYRRMLPGGGYEDDATSNSRPVTPVFSPSNTAGLKSRARRPKTAALGAFHFKIACGISKKRFRNGDYH